jgi:Glycosyltransferase family 87
MLLTKAVGRERVLVALAIVLVGASAVVPAAACLGVMAAALAGVTCLALAPALARRMPSELDGSAGRHPWPAIGLVFVALLACAQVGRISCFMADDTRIWGSTVPDPMVAHHACLGAYIEAAALSEVHAANVYAEEHYPAYRGTCGVPGSAYGISKLGGWMSDPYLYPPPFLIVPRLVIAVTHDFDRIRLVWFVAQVLLLLAGIVALALWVSGTGGRRWLLLLPAMFASPPTLLMLQFGQAHGLVVLAAVGAMAALDAAPALTGALLASAILAKITPAVLLVPLVAGRRWRALGWTAAFVVGLSIVTVLWLGPAPFEAFARYQVPRLASGDAFSFLDRQDSVFLASRNFSIQGIATRLRLLGVVTMRPDSFGILAAVVLATVCALGWTIGRSRIRPAASVVEWLAILNLAVLCSPAAPSAYVTVPALWLVAVLSASRVTSTWWTFSMVAAWVLIVGPPPLPDRLDLVVAGMGQVSMIAVCAWPLMRVLRIVHDGSAAHAVPMPADTMRMR